MKAMSLKAEWKKTCIHIWGEQSESHVRLRLSFLDREDMSMFIDEEGLTSGQRDC